MLPPLHGLVLSISSKGSFIYTIPHRRGHTTPLVAPVVEHWLEWEIVQWGWSKRSEPNRFRKMTVKQNFSVQHSHCEELYTFFITFTKLFYATKKKFFTPHTAPITSLLLLSWVHCRPQSASHGCVLSNSHWAISHSSQCSTTGVTKAILYVLSCLGWCI